MLGEIAMNAARISFAADRRRRSRPRRFLARVGIALLAVVVALATAGQVSAATPGRVASVVAPMAATSGTGTGGAFNPLLTRLVDTRSGVGGYSTPGTANVWRSVQVTGIGGIPASGVASVAMTVTALNPAAEGALTLAPNTSLSGSPTFLVFEAGDNVSNSGVVDVGTDGKIAVKANTSVNMLIDVQGYFTVGNGTPAPGGYVSAHSTRIVNTATGVGVATAGKLAASSTTTISATGGNTGIPATASAVYANITVQTASTTDNFVTAFSTGTPRPNTSLNYPGSPTAGTVSATALGATVDLNSSGQFDLYIGPGAGTAGVNVIVDIQGYFDGEPSTSGFTPLTSRVLDTRVAPAVPLPANSVTTVQLGGVGGIPNGSTSLAGVALNAQTLNGNGSVGGYLRMWPSDQTEPNASTINFDPNSITSNLTVIQPALSTGTIKVRNVSSVAVNLVLDAEGYFTNPSVLPAAIGPNNTNTGSRTAGAMIKRTLTDRSGVQINPGNGNLLYTQSLLSLAGIGQSATVGLRYNALNDARPTLNVGQFEGQLYRNGTTNTVTYTAPDGGGYVFAATGNSYTGTDAAGNSKTLYSYTVPTGLNASLVRVGAGYGPGTEYDLTMHPGQTVNVYADNGSNITLNSSQDVTGANHINYTYARGALTTITDTQGRTISFAYTDPNNTTQPSTVTDNSLGRTITLTYAGPQGALSKIVDATGAQTQFTYAASGKMATVTDGRGNVTAFSYDTGFKLLTMTTASGSTSTTPGVWTWVYNTALSGTPATRTTDFTDPNNHTATYTIINNTAQVTRIKDARGYLHSSGYNTHNDTTAMANDYNDTTNIGIADSTYNLTSITAPTTGTGGTGTAGRTQSYQYTTAPSGPGGTYSTADYRPQFEKDAQNNQTALTYNQFGETTAIGTPQGQGGTLHRGYQGDNTAIPAPDCGGKTGQLCTSTDGNGNTTSYSYTAGNVTTITPPAPLGVKTFSYDPAGRKISEHDGRGNTAYTCYDNNDRITQVSYTTAACGSVSGVTYTYDQAGNTTRRIDASGTTTIAYDAMNRPTSKSVGSTVTSVGYDPAGNITSYTDAAGTVNYTYDATNDVLTLAEPGGSCPAGVSYPNSTKCIGFHYDRAQRRDITSLPNGVTNTTAYDTSGRVASITAATGGTTLAARQYTYHNGTAAGDSSLIWTTTDPVAAGGSTINGYLYDAMNRLKQTATGPTPAPNVALVPTKTTNWNYDLNGNRTQQIITGTGAATTNYGYNAADQLCWSAATTGAGCTTPAGGTAYTYDGNGNQTTADTTYSTYNQLTAAATVGTQTYAGTTNNERSAAGSTNFTNSILGKISSAADPYTNQEYIRDPSGTLIAMQVTNAGTTSDYYYTADNVGSIIAVTNGAGGTAATYTYDSYGNTTATTGGTFATTTNPWRYGSGYTDTNSTIKLGARYYNPTTGRFTQPDPSGQEANNYAYAGDNPISNSDPTGLDPASDILTGIGALGTGLGLIFAPEVTIPLGLIGAGVAGSGGGLIAKGFGEIPVGGYGCTSSGYCQGDSNGVAGNACTAGGNCQDGSSYDPNSNPNRYYNCSPIDVMLGNC